MCAKIRYKIIFHAILLSFFTFFTEAYLPCYKYGCIMSVDENRIKGSTVENVLLYCKKNCKSDKRITRKGILVKRKDAKGTIIFCHGFTCDKNDIGFLRYIFPDYNCMAFDFRAHGDNTEGQFCSFGKHEAFDVKAAAKFLRQYPELKDKPILVYGFSMGAVAAIEAQSKDSSLFDAMILDCPFDSAENVIKRGLDNKKISLFGFQFHIPGRTILQKYVFHPYIQSFVQAVLKAVAQLGEKNIDTFMCPLHPIESVKKVKVPCLFIHCKKDEKVSVDAIKSIYYNAASKYKKLWITNGRRHFDSFFYNPEKYAYRLKKFADKAVGGILQKKYKHKIIEDQDVDLVRSLLNVGKVKTIKKGG